MINEIIITTERLDWALGKITVTDNKNLIMNE